MQRPYLTPDQIQQRCTEQSFTRGLEYFKEGAIRTPVLHGYTLSAMCYGTETDPYRVTVELMPTTIADTCCSCPYSGEGACKHIVALLLTYIYAPQTICSVDTLLVEFSEKPRENLLNVISELLKRTPELVPVAQVYADMPIVSPHPGPLPLVSIYREQIDKIFGRGFFEQHHLRKILMQLEGIVRHAESLAQLGETEIALSILYALIHQSIERYSDTLQQSELPRFVQQCTKTFTQISVKTQKSDPTDFGTEPAPTSLPEHCRMLLHLSFETEQVFTSLLTSCLENSCLTQETSDLQTTIVQRLDESRDRQAHVRLLLALYLHTGETKAYLDLARSERETYRLIHALFTFKQDDAAWHVLETASLSVDEYESFLKSSIATRVPQFTDKLLRVLEHHQPDTAILLYQRLIEQLVFSRKRANYKKVRTYLMTLKPLYQHLNQEKVWAAYLSDFRKRHARKRLLLQIIAEI